MKKINNDFVFIDANNRPYWCTVYNNEPWIFYWHDFQKSWVTLRKVSQVDILEFRKMEIPKQKAAIYHELHKKFQNREK